VAGAGGCLITDAWDGIELFLTPGSEVLVARDGKDVVDITQTLTAEQAAAIGRAGRQRILAEHTYDRRAAALHARLQLALARRREALAA
jgi:spore maturation protein CgeB